MVSHHASGGIVNYVHVLNTNRIHFGGAIKLAGNKLFGNYASVSSCVIGLSPEQVSFPCYSSVGLYLYSTS